jgi:KH domain-containing protein
MKQIFSDKAPRISKAKWELEKVLNVKIQIKGRDVEIVGEPVDEFVAEKVIDAINIGFEMKTALLLKEEEFILEIINIKEHTKRRDLETIRARIIGTERKTLNTLEQLTHCFFQVKDNLVGVIGPAAWIENAQQSIISLIKGSKQANVYGFLEHHQIPKIEDLGIKEPAKKKISKK